MVQFFKSILEQDRAPVVVCDTESIIIYMNPSAVSKYHRDLTGENLKACHSPEANKKIDQVLEWFKKSTENNIVYTYRNDKENKHVYMVALRNSDGNLIGYYEKHEFRNREITGLYEMK